MHSWKKTILLYEHQWNTRWAFAHKQDIFHMKITCYLQKWLWLQKPLKRTQMCSCVIETSSVLPQKSLEIFGNFRQMFRNDWSVLGQLLVIFGNLRKKSSKKFSLVCLYSKQNLMFNSIYHLFTGLAHEIRYQVEYLKRNSISTCTHVLSSIY